MIKPLFIFFVLLNANAEPVTDIEKAGPVAQDAAESTAMMIESPQIPATPGGYLLDWKTPVYCKGHPFRGQQKLAGGFCSSFLIAPDTVVTAGHCMMKRDCVTGIKFAFGLQTSKGVAPTKDVYSCKTLHFNKIPNLNPGGKYSYTNDIAIIKLDRPVEGRKPLEMDFSTTTANSNPTEGGLGGLIVSVGHADGLSTKAANGSRVTQPGKGGSGVSTSAQIIGGMSGGPVVSLASGKVVGVSLTGSRTIEDKKSKCLKIEDPYISTPGEGRDVSNYFKGYGYATTQSLRDELSRTKSSYEVIRPPADVPGTSAK